MCASRMDSPSIVDASRIASGGLSVTPDFLRAGQVSALRADARALHRAGAFVRGGLRRRRPQNKTKGGRTTDAEVTTVADERTRLCDVCGLFDDAEGAGASVGDRDAREDLLDVVADLREVLQEELGVRLLESMELQYLRYPGCSGGGGGGKKSGFYQRHFDHTGDDDKPYRRKVSLLLYLNDEGWDAKTDGGNLRAYIRPKGKGGDIPPANVEDVVPEGGKLVLFDSTLVEHEVLPTRRERWAVVGWYLIDKQTKSGTARGREGGNKRPHGSRNEQNNSSKKKKKKRRKRR